jgi:transcriptional regulator with XRE-family HTH domain
MRTEREAQGLSLRQLAYFTGVSHATIHQLEHDLIDASPAIRVRVARALRVRVDELWPDLAPEMREPGFDRARGSRGDDDAERTG